MQFKPKKKIFFKKKLKNKSKKCQRIINITLIKN